MNEVILSRLKHLDELMQHARREMPRGSGSWNPLERRSKLVDEFSRIESRMELIKDSVASGSRIDQQIIHEMLTAIERAGLAASLRLGATGCFIQIRAHLRILLDDLKGEK